MPNLLDAQLIWPLDAKFYQRPTNSTTRHQLDKKILTPNSLDTKLILPLDAKLYQRPTNSTTWRQLDKKNCFSDWLKILHGQISTGSQNSSEAKQPTSKCLGDQSPHFAKDNLNNNKNLEKIVKGVKMLLCEIDWMDLSEILSKQHLIQMMLVGIKLIECFMTTLPPLYTTCRGCKHWKYLSLNHKHAITVVLRLRR